MVLNFAPSTSFPTPLIRTRPFLSNYVPRSVGKHHFRGRATQSEGFTEEPSLEGSSARTQLDLLEQLTSTSPSTSGYDTDGSSLNPTIRDQLSQLVGDREGEFSLPLGKKLKASLNSLTISQKRNIRRQAYLDKVSQRNDTRFFATIAAFVILPPFLLLAVAVLTGYVELLP